MVLWPISIGEINLSWFLLCVKLYADLHISTLPCESRQGINQSLLHHFLETLLLIHTVEMKVNLIVLKHYIQNIFVSQLFFDRKFGIWIMSQLGREFHNQTRKSTYVLTFTHSKKARRQNSILNTSWKQTPGYVQKGVARLGEFDCMSKSYTSKVRNAF